MAKDNCPHKCFLLNCKALDAKSRKKKRVLQIPAGQFPIQLTHTGTLLWVVLKAAERVFASKQLASLWCRIQAAASLQASNRRMLVLSL